MQHANAKQVAGISRKRTTIGLRMFFLILKMSLDALLASDFTYYETHSIRNMESRWSQNLSRNVGILPASFA